MADNDKTSSVPPPAGNRRGGRAVEIEDDNAPVLIYTTFPSAEDAKRIGRALVERRLAACVNIIPQMTAIYVWEDKLQEDGEIAMIVKTTAERSEEAMQMIKQLHPYSVPARLVLPVVGGGDDFLTWISQQCGIARQS